ncbi:hypothetical protein D3OALGA1CA_1566 [Olavius algarvensis associated proteobacterium Delta 3]|nr:hypothetical protein D3OALGB2SA_364 [Olavius algarvensis associated proteobacterium Delta 3]CAB5103108.1 hypothetical protein D3OALGA1CA_1566 [Olavius algarvensis associated proteobacterium Delta 3]
MSGSSSTCRQVCPFARSTVNEQGRSRIMSGMTKIDIDQYPLRTLRLCDKF